MNRFPIPMLVDVIEARQSQADGRLDLRIIVTNHCGNPEPEEIPYTLDPSEFVLSDGRIYGLGMEISAWFVEHPDVEILPPLPIPLAEVKAEAARRISEIVPRWMIDRALTGGKPVPQELQDAAQAIRERSDEIEAMDSIPQDFREDKYWT